MITGIEMTLNETFIEQTVIYSLELEGKFVLVEQVPARVCVKTGERFFTPEVVERLQEIQSPTFNPHD